jgi:hypothetical protein
MKVKLLVSRYGPNTSQNAGEIVDIEDATAKRMIAAGQCEPVSKKAEKATRKQQPQTAVEK